MATDLVFRFLLEWEECVTCKARFVVRSSYKGKRFVTGQLVQLLHRTYFHNCFTLIFNIKYCLKREKVTEGG